jgi:hypothetical protein
MFKHYCDCCGAEITDANNARGGPARNPVSDWRFGGRLGRLSIEVMTAIDGTWNAGHVCRYCIIDAVNSFDDRERYLDAGAKDVSEAPETNQQETRADPPKEPPPIKETR